MTIEQRATQRTFSGPPDWWEAFEAAARAAGIPLSEWVGEACKKALPRDVRQGLSERVRAGRKLGAKAR